MLKFTPCSLKKLISISSCCQIAYPSSKPIIPNHYSSSFPTLPLLIITILTISSNIQFVHSTIAWQDSTYFDTGQIAIFSSTHTNNETSLTLLTFSETFDVYSTAASPNIGLGITTLIGFPTSDLSYKIGIVTITPTAFQFHVQLLKQTVLYSLTMDYIAISDSMLEFDYRFAEHNCTVLNQGSGLRSENVTFDLTTKTEFNGESHSIMLNVYWMGFDLSNPNGSYFYLDWQHTINRTHYTVELITDGTNIVTFVDFFLLAFDQVYAVYERSYYYGGIKQLESNSSFANFNPATRTPNFRYQSSNRMMLGLSGFNITRSTAGEQFHLYYNTTNYAAPSTGFTMTLFEYVKISNTVMARRQCQQSPATWYNRDTNDCDTSCPPQYPHKVTGNDLCETCHYSCNTCDGYGIGHCTVDCPATRQMGVGINFQCPCQSGYLQIGITQCTLCSVYLPGCDTCASYTNCTSCKSGYTHKTTTSTDCRCSNLNYTFARNDDRCIQILGCISSINYTDTSTGTTVEQCTQCNTTSNFKLMTDSSTNLTTCQCQIGSQFVQGYNDTLSYCQFVCGNGIYTEDQECDDGNLEDSDGCSATCTVEDGYMCIVKGEGYESVCVMRDYNGDITKGKIHYELRYLGNLKLRSENTVDLYFQIDNGFVGGGSSKDKIPDLTNLMVFDWVSFQGTVTSDDLNITSETSIASLSSSSYSPIVNLKISLQYQSSHLPIDQSLMNTLTLNLSSQTVSLSPNTASTENLSNPFTTFQIKSTNYKLIDSSQNSTADQSILKLLILILVIFTFLICLISTYTTSMSREKFLPAIESIQTIQYFFFYLLLMKTFDESLIPLIEELKYVVSGYLLSQESSISVTTAHKGLYQNSPSYFKSYFYGFSAQQHEMNYRNNFVIENVNLFMGALLLIPGMLLAIKKIVPKILNRCSSQSQSERRKKSWLKQRQPFNYKKNKSSTSMSTKIVSYLNQSKLFNSAYIINSLFIWICMFFFSNVIFCFFLEQQFINGFNNSSENSITSSSTDQIYPHVYSLLSLFVVMSPLFIILMKNQNLWSQPRHKNLPQQHEDDYQYKMLNKDNNGHQNHQQNNQPLNDVQQQFDVYCLVYIAMNYVRIFTLVIVYDSEISNPSAITIAPLVIQLVYIIVFLTVLKPYSYVQKNQTQHSASEQTHLKFKSLIHTLHNISNSISLIIYLIVITLYNHYDINLSQSTLLATFLVYWVLVYMFINLFFIFIRAFLLDFIGSKINQCNCECCCKKKDIEDDEDEERDDHQQDDNKQRVIFEEEVLLKKDKKNSRKEEQKREEKKKQNNKRKEDQKEKVKKSNKDSKDNEHETHKLIKKEKSRQKDKQKPKENQANSKISAKES